MELVYGTGTRVDTRGCYTGLVHGISVRKCYTASTVNVVCAALLCLLRMGAINCKDGL